MQAEVSTDSLEVQFSGGLDLIELERPSALAVLAEASDLIESDFWSTSGAEFDLAVANPELVGFAPAELSTGLTLREPIDMARFTERGLARAFE